LLTNEKQHARLRRRRKKKKKGFFLFLTEEEDSAMFLHSRPAAILHTKLSTLFSYFSSTPSKPFVLPASNLGTYSTHSL
jgi:hypothetical protein